jgi:hypothetical protein
MTRTHRSPINDHREEQGRAPPPLCLTSIGTVICRRTSEAERLRRRQAENINPAIEKFTERRWQNVDSLHISIDSIVNGRKPFTFGVIDSILIVAPYFRGREGVT